MRQARINSIGSDVQPIGWTFAMDLLFDGRRNALVMANLNEEDARIKNGTALRKNEEKKKMTTSGALLDQGLGEQTAHHFISKPIRIDLIFAAGNFFLERLNPIRTNFRGLLKDILDLLHIQGTSRQHHAIRWPSDIVSPGSGRAFRFLNLNLLCFDRRKNACEFHAQVLDFLPVICNRSLRSRFQGYPFPPPTPL